MPKKLQEPNFTNIAPSQVRISGVIEIGTQFAGGLPAWLPKWVRDCDCGLCCERCQCQTKKELAQINRGIFSGSGTIKIRDLSPGPVKIAKTVVYERVQQSDSEQGEAVVRQARVILEMSQEAYDQMPEKDMLVEIGTTETGARRYLFRPPALMKRR